MEIIIRKLETQFNRLPKSRQLCNSSTWNLVQKRRRAVSNHRAEVDFLDRKLSRYYLHKLFNKLFPDSTCEYFQNLRYPSRLLHTRPRSPAAAIHLRDSTSGIGTKLKSSRIGYQKSEIQKIQKYESNNWGELNVEIYSRYIAYPARYYFIKSQNPFDHPNHPTDLFVRQSQLS
ncbi:hypothetical protein DID88_001505 [Monilinia fructigena]|uniref:Uncharacterized protein n=1 Tax=Monilinia fructigena TaxID=38457 RepID=A0A395IXC1_9HELO|nr:hypothetical protein DID88_001505 [Monilinia fructigena]